jgi:hypothetical protein
MSKKKNKTERKPKATRKATPKKRGKTARVRLSEIARKAAFNAESVTASADPDRSPAAAEHRDVTKSPKERFLKAFAELAYIGLAAKKAGIHRGTHYKWLDEDPEYEEAFKHLKEDVIEMLEREADRRGHDGILKPILYEGVIVHHIREYSDTLLIFRLKALKPEMYRDNVKIDASMKHSGAIKVEKEPFDWDEYRRLCDVERAAIEDAKSNRAGQPMDPAHPDSETSEIP